MKRKLILTVLALILAAFLFGCGKGKLPPFFTMPATDEDTTVVTDKPTDTGSDTEEADIEWSYSLTTEKLEKEHKAENGKLLASVSIERPVLELMSDGGNGGETPPDEMQRICGAFNENFEELYSDSSADEVCSRAEEYYNTLDKDNQTSFIAFEERVTVKGQRVEGDLVELVVEAYGYYGGAHGLMSRTGFHFDLQTGSFFGLADVTDDISELNGAIADEIVSQIYSNDEYDKFFSTVADTIRNYSNYNFSLGDDSLTVLFGEYEIAPYAAGLPEFEISYGVISRYLNENGERLLAPSAESKVMGDFREAYDMWYWFEGMIPVDYNDSITVKQNGSEWTYMSVDISGASSVDDVRNMMLTRMTEELVDKRLDGITVSTDVPFFREVDGKLYALPYGRGGDMTIRSIDYSVKINAGGKDGKVTASITWQDYDDKSGDWVLTGEVTDVDFPFELTDHGAVFTDFHTLW